ncbi:MAG: PIN domain-containing protein, partial [Aquisalimonadaceae bacterium]
RFLEGFDVIPIDSNVAERAVVLRRTNGIRLPDALIQATAERNNALLDTRNTKDFPSYLPGIRVPYEL